MLLELSPQPVQIHHEANEKLRLSINMQIESSHATLGESLNLISRHFPRVLSPSRFCSLPQRCREWSNPQGRNFYSSGLIKRLERSFPREPLMRILSVLFALNKRENRFHILDLLTGIQWRYGYTWTKRYSKIGRKIGPCKTVNYTLEAPILWLIIELLMMTEIHWKKLLTQVIIPFRNNLTFLFLKIYGYRWVLTCQFSDNKSLVII